jgi:hypothetical protein
MRLITLWHNVKQARTGHVKTHGSVIRAPPAPRERVPLPVTLWSVSCCATFVCEVMRDRWSRFIWWRSAAAEL